MMNQMLHVRIRTLDVEEGLFSLEAGMKMQLIVSQKSDDLATR